MNEWQTHINMLVIDLVLLDGLITGNDPMNDSRTVSPLVTAINGNSYFLTTALLRGEYRLSDGSTLAYRNGSLVNQSLVPGNIPFAAYSVIARIERYLHVLGVAE